MQKAFAELPNSAKAHFVFIIRAVFGTQKA